MVSRVEEKSEIMKIPDRNIDTLDNLIDNSDIKLSNQLDSLDLLKLFNKMLHNILRSRSGSSILLEMDYLDNNISITLLKLVSMIRGSQIY